MSSPCTPQTQGRRQAQQQDDVLQPVDTNDTSVNSITEQLLCISISKPGKKREQATTTPASQARPRAQRRTDGQENAPAALSAAVRDGSVTPSRLSCFSQLQDELSCAVCLEICIRPCATPCGHAFCKSCLRQAMKVKRQCPKCRSTLPPATGWQPKVNTALWNVIQLLFPNHAAQAPPPTPEVQIAPPTAAGRTRTAASSSSRPRHRRTANTLGGGEAEGNVFSDASVRQGFRPPRSTAVGQPGQQHADHQQRSADVFVMPPDLGAMLQGMQRAEAESASQRRTRGQAVARASESSTGSQQQHSHGTNPSARPQAAANNGNGDNTNIRDLLTSGYSTWNPAAEQRARAASAAPAHSATADDLRLGSRLAHLDDEQALRAAILASLNDSGAATSTATGLESSQQRSSTRGGAHTQRAFRGRRQQPSRLPHSLSLFGRVHSGSSPQQQWAAHDDDRSVQPEDRLLQGMIINQQRTYGEGGNSRSLAPQPVNGWRQRAAFWARARAAASVVEMVDGLSELEDDDDDGDEDDEIQLLPAAVPQPYQLLASTTTVAGRATGRRRAGRARIISEDEEDDMQLPAAQDLAATAQADTAMPARSSLLVGARQQDSAIDRQLRAESAAARFEAVASAIRIQDAQIMEQIDLALRPSPEPQPLAARLARLGERNRTQPDETGAAADSLQSGGACTSHSPVTEQPQSGTTSSAAFQVQDDLTAGPINTAAMNDSSSRGHGRASAAAVRTRDRTINVVVANDESSDDFEPVSQPSGRRLTAARAAASSSGESGRGHVGRVVSGLQRGQRANKHRGIR